MVTFFAPFFRRNRRRRAKALLDFERHDDDELGFRKNDIVTVRSDTTIKFFHKLYFDDVRGDCSWKRCCYAPFRQGSMVMLP